MTQQPTLSDLADPSAPIAFLDDPGLDESTLDEDQKYFRRWGYLIKRRFAPAPLIDAYCDRWLRDNQTSEVSETSEVWTHSPTPFTEIPELRDLCLWAPLSDLLGRLIGRPMALNLNLCGWQSTERNWHSDSYLNPPGVGGHYIAVWFALHEIHPDSGPFQFVPASHQWPALSRERTLAHLQPHERQDPTWPKIAERFVTRAIEQKITSEGWAVQEFCPASKGDVLFWHSRLIHRGSSPKVPGMERRALIAHYSAIGRADFPAAVQHGSQGWYFPFA